MDYAEEQAMEVEALEAIYMDDFKRLDDAEGMAVFEVTVVPEQGGDEDVNHVSVAMRVAYTPTYPEAAPELSVRAVKMGGLTEESVGECEALLREAASSEELLGTPMVYALAEKAQEWLVEHNQPEMDMHQEMMARLAKEQKDAAPAVDIDDGEEESVGRGALRIRRKGATAGSEPEGSWRVDPVAVALPADSTPVTPETFAKWRKEFLEVQAATAAAAAMEVSAKSGNARNRAPESQLTGRQIFERSGASLVDGDVGALEEGEEDLMIAGGNVVAEGAEEGGEGADAMAAASLLDAVGDADLFDDDEDLPDDDDE
jgi:hypothetical protein